MRVLLFDAEKNLFSAVSENSDCGPTPWTVLVQGGQVPVLGGTRTFSGHHQHMNERF